MGFCYPQTPSSRSQSHTHGRWDSRVSLQHSNWHLWNQQPLDSTSEATTGIGFTDLRAPGIVCLMYSLSCEILMGKNTDYPGEIDFLCVENCLDNHVSICRVAGNFHRQLIHFSLEFIPVSDGMVRLRSREVQVHTHTGLHQTVRA